MPASNDDPDDAAGLSEPFRLFLAVAAALQVVAGVSLYVFSDRTAQWFAWTLDPVSAAYLGALFWATLGPIVFCVVDRRWVYARAVVPATLAFAVPLTVATMLHLDRFHFVSSSPTARFAAWLWTSVYVIVPPTLAMLAYRQERRCALPPRRRALSWPLRIGVAITAALAAAVGVCLFVLPAEAGEFWPWPLTALAARAVAAGLLGLGAGAAYAATQNDGDRALLAFPSLAGFGILQLLAMVRFAGDVQWFHPSAWLLVVFCLGLVALGLGGTITVVRQRVPAPGPRLTAHVVSEPR